MFTSKALLRLSELEHKIGWKRSTIYSWMQPNSIYFKPDFPRPLRIGKSVRWLASSIDDWINKSAIASAAHQFVAAN